MVYLLLVRLWCLQSLKSMKVPRTGASKSCLQLPVPSGSLGYHQCAVCGLNDGSDKVSLRTDGWLFTCYPRSTLYFVTSSINNTGWLDWIIGISLINISSLLMTIRDQTTKECTQRIHENPCKRHYCFQWKWSLGEIFVLRGRCFKAGQERSTTHLHPRIWSWYLRNSIIFGGTGKFRTCPKFNEALLRHTWTQFLQCSSRLALKKAGSRLVLKYHSNGRCERWRGTYIVARKWTHRLF